MRVLLISHACVVDTNRGRVEALARHEDLEVMLLTVRTWRDREGGQVFRFTAPDTDAYIARAGLAAINWHPTMHFYVHGLRGAIHEFRPDILHIDECYHSLPAFQATFLTRRHPAKLVLFNFQNIHRRLPWPLSWAARYSLQRGDAVIAGGFGGAGVLRQAGYAGPIEVIPPGLDESLYRPMDASAMRKARGLDAFTIGYVGRLVPEKGLMTLLRAAGKLSGRWQLYLIGEGSQAADLRSEAFRLGIADRVVFAGQVPHRDIPEHIACADVVAVPSETTPRWMEQFGRTIIEAMACARPVVGSDSGEIARVIGEDGLVFPEHDADALAACLWTLQQDPKLREELAERGRAKVLKEYTWTRIAERTKALYEKVLAQS